MKYGFFKSYLYVTGKKGKSRTSRRHVVPLSDVGMKVKFSAIEQTRVKRDAIEALKMAKITPNKKEGVIDFVYSYENQECPEIIISMPFNNNSFQIGVNFEI